MPRTARKKSPAGIYHIMVRSISEIMLFRNSKDKERYLAILKKYKEIYLFEVYAYCLMSTHAHIVIDCCAADISKIMKSINQSYAAYYNIKYQRHGHVFQDRFKSKLVDNDNYLLNLTAYIHNNPKDIKGYENNVHKYSYSSFGIYLGIRSDKYDILNYTHILDYFSKDIIKARSSYVDLVNRLYTAVNLKEIDKDIEFTPQSFEYRSERNIILRNMPPEEIINYISKVSGIKFDPRLKHSRKNTELKALFVIIMRSLTDASLTKICTYFSNITLSNVWKLSEMGFRLLTTNIKYMHIIDDLVSKYRNYIPSP
ncbi:transposase [Clostridium thermarum]|uniref:transposase n=1 Tax=Clostridium thermarum TaxID=1716543 RepID=UPI0011210E29|nr:transposase [Clostridium thermarum]